MKHLAQKSTKNETFRY